MAQTVIDLVNLGGGVQTLYYPKVLAASSQGASFDAQNLDVVTNAIVSYGTIGAGNTQAFVAIEESADGSTNWTTISGMTCDGGTSGGSNSTQVLHGYRAKEFVRANVLTVAGTTPSAAVSVVLVSQGKYVPQDGGYSNYPST